jgi:hypothetical protein
MSGTHRRKLNRHIGRHTKKVALAGAATITAAALTASLVPPPTAEMLNPDLKLAGVTKSVGGLTGGLTGGLGLGP